MCFALAAVSPPIGNRKIIFKSHLIVVIAGVKLSGAGVDVLPSKRR